MKRKVVTFVPFFEAGNRRRYDATFFFDDSILRLDLALLETFASLPTYHFIIKALRGTTFGRILRRRIAEMGRDNLEYREDNLARSLAQSDRAILDYPSSSILEVERLKVPALVLSYSELTIREEARSSLRYTTIRTYTSQQEGQRIVRQFLEEK